MSSAKGRKRRRRQEDDSSESESEWEADEDQQEEEEEEGDESLIEYAGDENDDEEDGDEDEDDNYSEEGDKKPPAKKKKGPAAAKKKKKAVETGEAKTATTTTTTAACSKSSLKRRRKLDADYDVDDIPASYRMTERGGYAHTKKTKLLISQRNTGNTPWNKGKQRSGTDRAKIGAGVRARNRTILLKKLETLGLTEEEWDAKRRKVNALRERLRKLRRQNSELAVKEEAERKLKNEQGASEGDNGHGREEPDDGEEEEDEEEEKESGAEGEDLEIVDSTTAAAAVSSIFAQDFHWTPHPLGSAPPDGVDVDASPSSSSYANGCPNGGSGGLICCAACAANYSKYLSTTYQELEQQKISKASEEVTELLGLLQSSRGQLEKTVLKARKKPPPPRK